VLEPGARIPSIQAWKDFYPVLTLFAFLSETELWIELGSLSLSLFLCEYRMYREFCSDLSHDHSCNSLVILSESAEREESNKQCSGRA
jgi:hypothetical protein